MYEEIPKGQLSTTILSCLKERDKYGYEIIDEVLRNTNGKVSIKQPSLYSNLKRMEEQSLISSYWRESEIGGRRHYYHLTDLGKKHLEKWETNAISAVKNDSVDENATKVLQQENLFNLSSRVEKQDEKVQQQPNNSVQNDNAFIQFDLFSKQTIVNIPDYENDDSVNKTVEVPDEYKKTNQSPILTEFEKDDTPVKYSKFEYIRKNRSFSDSLSNVNAVEQKRYVEKLDDSITHNDNYSTSNSQESIDENPECIENEAVLDNDSYVEQNNDVLTNDVIQTTEEDITSQDTSPLFTDNKIIEPETKSDDGVFITDRIEVKDLPKSKPYQSRRFEFYVSGNSIGSDNYESNYEDRVKELYEKSKNNSDNQGLEFIDKKYELTTYKDLEDFYKQQNIKFKPYQKTLKKSANNINMIKINKLNMLLSLFVFGFYSVLSLLMGIILIGNNNVYMNKWITFFVYPLILLVIFLICLFNYNKFPQKQMPKNNLLKMNSNLCIISAVMVPIILAINMFCGFSFSNFGNYIISFVYLSIIALTYFVYYFSIKLVTKWFNLN